MLHPILSNISDTGVLRKQTKLSPIVCLFCIVYYLHFHFHAIPFAAWMEPEEALTSFDFLKQKTFKLLSSRVEYIHC